MPHHGPIKEESDAMVWSGVNEEDYPFEVRAETFAFGPDAATGQDDALVLEAGDEFVNTKTGGATSYVFRHAERTTKGTWALVWDMVSTDPHDDGRVASGGPANWAMQIRDGRLVPAEEYGQESTGVIEL